MSLRAEIDALTPHTRKVLIIVHNARCISRVELAAALNQKRLAPREFGALKELVSAGLIDYTESQYRPSTRLVEGIAALKRRYGVTGARILASASPSNSRMPN